MKFGETLQQQSSPAFRRHNIDYDDIKLFIKERTTPGEGKAISIPGRGDQRLLEFESDLFNILKEQHDRIDVFVKCKVGEVQRRQDDCRKLLHKLATKATPSNDRRITVNRLQRYGGLENEVVRAADELKSLARFNANQRTAFRKLLKKYRKWTGSADLPSQFRTDVLDDPKSFTQLDLGPLLDEYSATRQKIRSLYEDTVQQASNPSSHSNGVPAGSSVVHTLRAAIQSDSLVEFDTAFATVPLGRSGTYATYFIHPDNVVELQMFLLQYARYFSLRSRSNSLAQPISPTQQLRSSNTFAADPADYHLLAADCLDRFSTEQSALTVDDREHSPGSTLLRAKALVCWNHLDQAVAVLRSSSGRTKSASLKSKRAPNFFDRTVNISAKNDISGDVTIREIREEVTRDERLRPLFEMACCRSRLVGLKDDPDNAVMMTLDTDIFISAGSTDPSTSSSSKFPYALLVVRQEGSSAEDFISMLDHNHLAERVRGFSLEYHAVWQVHQPPNIPQPFWLPILHRDIRKLPPPAFGQHNALTSQGKPTAASNTSVDIDSIAGITDSTTAVDTTNDTSQVGSPPLKFSASKRKKTRIHPEIPIEQPTKYWSEYDHPEDGENQDDAYVLYIDPHERSAFDRFFDKAGKIFGYGHHDHEYDYANGLISPATDDETSSDEATHLTTDQRRSYGAIFDGAVALSSADFARLNRRTSPMPRFSVLCYLASLVILLFAYILAFTGRRRYVAEVQAGIFVAIVSSLSFVIIGVLAAFRRRTTGPLSRSLSVLLLILEGVASGGLIAWCFVK